MVVLYRPSYDMFDAGLSQCRKICLPGSVSEVRLCEIAAR